MPRLLLGIIAYALASDLSLSGLANAQSPPHTVEWTASVGPGSGGERKYALEVSGRIQPGWHVYALTQGPGGPVALRLTLEPNAVTQSAGAASGPVPHRSLDAALGFETQFYTDSFTIRLPLQGLRVLTSGELIPVSVRFQSCSDRECLPPTSVHLAAPFHGAPAS